MASFSNVRRDSFVFRTYEVGGLDGKIHHRPPSMSRYLHFRARVAIASLSILASDKEVKAVHYKRGLSHYICSFTLIFLVGSGAFPVAAAILAQRGLTTLNLNQNYPLPLKKPHDHPQHHIPTPTTSQSDHHTSVDGVARKNKTGPCVHTCPCHSP